MKIKHIIMTRWWMIPKGGVPINILDDKYLNHRLDYLTNNLLVSLENQTNKEFDFILQVHPKHTKEQIQRIKSRIQSVRPSFNCNVMVWDDSFHEYIHSLYDSCDILILTRIDDDDFVNRNAAQDTRDILGNGTFDMILSGYHYGYKYFEGTGKVQSMKHNYQTGHMSVFQSIITNTKKVPFSKNINPCMFNHTKVRNNLNELGYNLWFISFDRDDGYLWFRHQDAITYKPCDKKKDLIFITQEDKKR